MKFLDSNMEVPHKSTQRRARRAMKWMRIALIKPVCSSPAAIEEIHPASKQHIDLSEEEARQKVNRLFCLGTGRDARKKRILQYRYGLSHSS